MRTMFAWKVAMTTFEKIGVLYEVLKVSEIPLDYSSIAQLVEHAAVNRAVVGSSPTGGARGLPPQGGGNPTLKTTGL